MASSGMLRLVALVRTDVSEELSAFIIRVTRIDELGTILGISSQRASVLVTASAVPSTSETSVLTRATGRNIPQDAILNAAEFLIWV
jgi:hypothetical protein